MDGVQTEHTSWQWAPRALEPALQCDWHQTCQRTSKCLPMAAETVHPCRHTQVLQPASVPPAVKTSGTLLLSCNFQLRCWHHILKKVKKENFYLVVVSNYIRPDISPAQITSTVWLRPDSKTDYLVHQNLEAYL